MSYYLFEDPTITWVAGPAIVAMLAVALYHTGRGVLMAWIGLVVALTAGLVILELAVETDCEQVTKALTAAADALTTGDIKQVQKFVAPEAAAVQAKAVLALSLAEFKSISVGSDLEVTFGQGESPRTAESRFSCMAHYHAKKAESPYEYYPAKLLIRLRREEDRWLIVEVEELKGAGWGNR